VAPHIVKVLESLLPLFEVVEKQLPAVRTRIEDEEAPVRLAACQTVEVLTEYRRFFLPLEAAELKVRDKRFEAPWREGLRQTLPALEKSLTHKEVRVKLGALYALESYAAEAAPLAGSVVRTLTDENLYVRWAGVRVLGRTAPEAAGKAVPALAKLLTDDSEDVRVTAALVLGRYGPSARPAVADLAHAVEKGSAVLRLRAIASLGAAGREANDSQPALVLALVAPEPAVRRAAAQALSQIGPLTEKATTALRKALADSDAEVRRAASIALLQGK
jgi:HEAT repeat protein